MSIAELESRRPPPSHPAYRMPLTAAALTAAAFFVLCLVVLHPGYETDDDISMISLASGYVGGTRLPFLIYSNVLWGLLLDTLYGLPGRTNWGVVALLVTNFVATTGLLYLIFSRPLRASATLFGVLVVLLVDAHFILNITFTTSAAYACIAGFCLQLQGAHGRTGGNLGLVCVGVLLVLLGGLIRFESMLLSLALLLPPLILCARTFQPKRLFVLLAVTTGLVACAALADRMYVRASPEWSAFYRYDQARSLLHDTPRLANSRALAKQVGWTKNDLENFRYWFFPDAQVYSLAHLETLDALVSDKRRGQQGSELIFLRSLRSPNAAPYLVLLAAIGLCAWLRARRKRNYLPFAALPFSFVALALFLAWSMKLPDRVMLSFLAALALYSLAVFDWLSLLEPALGDAPVVKRFSRAVRASAVALVAVALVLVAVQSSRANATFSAKRAAYAGILADLDKLQADGTLPKDALIVSAGHGIPLEWSDPLVLDLPRVHYLPMGWLTFSPAYESVLKEFGVAALPDSLVRSKHLYLLTQASLMRGVQEFIRQHDATIATTHTIYKMPPLPGDMVYRQMVLYSVD